MRLWEPKSCGCCSLRTGSLIVGSLALTAAILDLINACVTFASVIIYLAKLKLVSCLEDEESDLCRDQLRNYYIGFCIALLVAEGIQVIVCCMLISGIYKEKPRLMVPYMVWSIIRLCTFFIWTVFSIVEYFYMPEVMLMLLGPLVILAVVETVYLLITRAQYRQMRQAQSESHTLLEEESADL